VIAMRVWAMAGAELGDRWDTLGGAGRGRGSWALGGEFVPGAYPEALTSYIKIK